MKQDGYTVDWVRDGVAAAFGIVLEPEPVLLGVEL